MFFLRIFGAIFCSLINSLPGTLEKLRHSERPFERLNTERSLGIDTYLIPEPMGTCVEMLWFWSQNPWEINSFLAFALSRVVGKG